MPMRLGYPAGRAGLRHSLSSAPLTHAAWCVRLRVALPDAPGSDILSLSALGAAARGNLIRHVRSFHDKICLCVYLLRENPLGPGRQHTRLDFMAGRLGPGVGGRVGGGAARGAGFAVGGV